MRILYAEDEQAMSSAVTKVLRMNNYIVDAVYDGQEALDFLLSEQYDGIILDIMMPKVDGIKVLTEIRKKGIKTPVMMLTAKAEISDRVEGLNAGADDYLPKPFAMAELLARVNALTRRGESYTPDIITFGNISLNRSTYELIGKNESIRLSKKEYQMMEMLINNRNALLSTEQFMTKIWGYDSDSEINVVWVYISYLRKKLTQLDADIQISAVRGRGYTLEMIKK